ncbi:Vacuolar protein 8 [Entophlyctis luteolus]|nr:Vacuolar protein 8 [Entophlyctis luteolus]
MLGRSFAALCACAACWAPRLYSHLRASDEHSDSESDEDVDDQESPHLSVNSEAASERILKSLRSLHSLSQNPSAVDAFVRLAHSQNPATQRFAAVLLSGLTDSHVDDTQMDTEPVDGLECSEVVRACVFLLRSSNNETKQAAATALGNLAINPFNQHSIVAQGALVPLVQILNSSESENVSELECNAVGCITNLATNDGNKEPIANCGIVSILVRILQRVDSHSQAASDIRILRNATGALLNLTHTSPIRALLVNVPNALSCLVRLLESPDYDVQYFCSTALSNIAVDTGNRELIANTEPGVVKNLIRLVGSPALKVQCQATLALRNLASDGESKLKENGLPGLRDLLSSRIPQTATAAVACVRNLSINPSNETPLIDANFLPPLLALVGVDNNEIQCHALSTIRNLSGGSGGEDSKRNRGKVLAAGVVERVGELIRLPTGILAQEVLVELTACLAALSSIVTGGGASVFLKYWKELRYSLIVKLSSNDSGARTVSVWVFEQLSLRRELQDVLRSDADLGRAVEEASVADA